MHLQGKVGFFTSFCCRIFGREGAYKSFVYASSRVSSDVARTISSGTPINNTTHTTKMKMVANAVRTNSFKLVTLVE